MEKAEQQEKEGEAERGAGAAVERWRRGWMQGSDSPLLLLGDRRGGGGGPGLAVRRVGAAAATRRHGGGVGE